MIHIFLVILVIPLRKALRNAKSREVHLKKKERKKGQIILHKMALEYNLKEIKHTPRAGKYLLPISTIHPIVIHFSYPRYMRDLIAFFEGFIYIIFFCTIIDVRP